MAYLKLKKSLLKLVNKNVFVNEAATTTDGNVSLRLSPDTRRAFKEVINHFTGETASNMTFAAGTRGSAVVEIKEKSVSVVVYDNTGGELYSAVYS